MIAVTSLQDHINACKKFEAEYLISAIDPGFEPSTPNSIKHHLKLGFDDIIEIKKENFIYRNYNSSTINNLYHEQILPNKLHIEKTIKFIESWDQSKPIVVHCWCGVSRSMAIATYILCKLCPESIISNIRYIRSKAPHANPNTLMLSMFEKYLGIEGKIIEAYKKYPYTKKYDCSTNFAPITIFNINEISLTS